MVHGTHNDKNIEGDFIDACAAPGNKTSHLAALIQKSKQNYCDMKKGGGLTNGMKKSKIFAFDRSSDRISILQNRLSYLIDDEDNQSKLLIDVIVKHQDFLKVNPSDKIYEKVRSILLDPSCSGSGMIKTHLYDTDSWGGDANEKSRIETLSNFQLLILKHAMSFPQVNHIV